jgi:hypothetical protein
MSDLKTSIQNVRLASAMEGDHMRASLLFSLVAETGDMSEGDVVEMVRQARAQLGIKDPAPGQVQESMTLAPAKQSCSSNSVATSRVKTPSVRPRTRSRVVVH